MVKKIVFLTGTRADFGKLKPLISETIKSKKFIVQLFVTGMHLDTKYGLTINEIIKSGYKKYIYSCPNHKSSCSMDIILANTIQIFSNFIKKYSPELIVIHGDRVEALAGAITGALNNCLVAHIEGGEVSGTIDELMRHSISKMSHIHFVSNNDAKNRLLQMGETNQSIYTIGSPERDLMNSKNLPDLETVKNHYGIHFDNYAIFILHPVTTELKNLANNSCEFVSAILGSKLNYIGIYPNNDTGSAIILKNYNRLINNPKINIFPSMRFEYFQVLLKNANFIIGNSSSGIKEAPFYGVPVINIGNRQNKRTINKDIINCGFNKKEVEYAIKKIINKKIKKCGYFGQGNSSKLFVKALKNGRIWKTNKQKYFNDLAFPIK